MKKNIAPHITALLAGAGAVLSVIHPGFRIPAGVEGVVASICVLCSTITEAIHFVKKHNLQSNIALAQTLANQVTANVKADTAPATPTA
jgi:hypothetical protein